MTEDISNQAKEEVKNLGQRLTDKREELALTIEEISRETRIPERYLKALEEEDFKELPGGVYASAFVRSYARRLGLDEASISAQYKAEVQLEEPVYNFALQEPPAESRRPTRAMILGGLVVAIAAYGTWFSLNTDPVDVAVSPVLPKTTVAAASEELHRGEIEKFAPGAGGEEEAVADLDQEVDASDVVEQIDAPVEMAEISKTGAEVEAKTLESKVARQDMVVEAIADSWIHITHGTDILYSGVMKAGNSFTVTAKEEVEMTTGNAGGVVLRLGDWSSGPLGPEEGVRRGISLSPSDWNTAQADRDHS
ncbi:MAG: DUF4115 domain-containing protein [Sphingomonadales bacterium]|jgi:cytoskeleton protein RodZ